MTEITKIDFIIRIVIVIIDVIFYCIISSILAFILTKNIQHLPDSTGWILLVGYILIFHCYLNQTPGMKVMGYMFVNTKLEKPAHWKMILRFFIASILSITFLGALIAAFTYNQESGFFWDRWFKIKMIGSGKHTEK